MIKNFFRHQSKDEEKRWNKTEKLLGELRRMMEEGSQIQKKEVAEERETIQKLEMSIKKQLEGNEQLCSAIQSQTETIEDFLDDQTQQLKLQETVKETKVQNRREQQALIALVMEQQDQLFRLKQQILSMSDITPEAKNGWKEQLQMMEQICIGKMQLCQMAVIGAIGEPVDYERMEILQVLEKGKADIEKTVAKVHTPGYIVKGEVVKKAVVDVYR